MERVLDAIDAFVDQITGVDWAPVGLAILAHLLRLACTSRAWRNVIAAAYPAVPVPWRSVAAAYVAGVGVNAIAPARMGDVVRLVMAHRAVPGSTYTTLLSTSLVLSIADTTFALAVFAYAFSLGVLPGFDVLPDLPSFDFAWFVDHVLASEIVIAVLVVGSGVLVFLVQRRVRDFWVRVAQAFAVLRSPRRYLRTVFLWQALDWSLRLTTIWFLLDAFGIEQSLRNVLLVQATHSLATLVPISPGGVGTEQAFLAYVFRGTAPQSQVLAFSVGMKLVTTAVNVTLGFAALALTLRTVRFREVAARKEREQTAEAETETG